MPDTKTIHRRRSKLDPFLDRLGLIADADIARLAGVTVQNVAAFRKRHNIALTVTATVPAPEPPATVSTDDDWQDMGDVETRPVGPPAARVLPSVSMSEVEYRAAHGRNFSMLRHLVTSPHAFRYFADAPKTPPTATQSLGTAIHMALLEPDKFSETYAVREKVDGRTKEGKAYNAQWEADNPGKTAIDGDTMDTVLRCVESVKNDAEYQRLTTEGEGVQIRKECPLFWFDALFGDCKARPDMLRWDGQVLTVWDLKTTAQRIDYHSVSRMLGEWLVPLQLALYARGASQRIGINPDNTSHVELKVTFVQTVAPFDAATYRISMSTHLTTNDLMEELAVILKDCTKRNTWPGLPTGNAIDVPAYYLTVK